MMRVCICIFTRVCICIYLKVCIWIHIMRVCICIYVYIRVFICIYMRVFICIYIKARTIPAITYYFPQIALLPGQTAQHLHKVSLSIFQYRYLSFYFCIVSTIHKHRPPRALLWHRFDLLIIWCLWLILSLRLSFSGHKDEDRIKSYYAVEIFYGKKNVLQRTATQLFSEFFYQSETALKFWLEFVAIHKFRPVKKMLPYWGRVTNFEI